MMTLEGRGIRLRPVRDADHPDILRWQNDPEVAWWMDYERTFTLQGHPRERGAPSRRVIRS